MADNHDEQNEEELDENSKKPSFCEKKDDESFEDLLESEDSLIKQLKSAYRKFKSYTYYDNYSAVNRAKLADFEFENSIASSDEFFEKLARDLKYGNRRKDLFKCLKSEINVLCYPKSVKSNYDDCKNPAPLSNIIEDSEEIEKLNFFIDLDVKSHILGTLWILRSGWVLDHRLHKNCHGNRINKEVLNRIEYYEKKNEKYSEPTPFLFEPYFKKYQTWRDEGLNSIEKLLDKKENAIMLTLDFQEYYYSATIDFQKLYNDIQNAKKKLMDNYNEANQFEVLDAELTCFIKDIFDTYSGFFERPFYEKVIKNEEKRLPMIPLGFLPSLIISNWNLQAFDQTILDFINPVYYGRYVDDILIVFNSHPESESFSNERGHISSEEIVKKYFIKRYFNYSFRDQNGDENKTNIFKEIPVKEILANKQEDSKNESPTNPSEDENSEIKGKDSKENKNTIYGVNDLYELENRYISKIPLESMPKVSNYENLRIQQKKLKIFLFNHNNSRALIENFKKEIYINSSEFRLMHKVESLYADIGKNIFSIHYDDSINKIGDIKSIKLNKFQLSKTLSWLIRTSIYENDGKISKENVKNIQHAFSGNNRIEFMILWEKFLEFLFIEGEYEILHDEIEKILSKISKLKLYNDDKTGQDELIYAFKTDSLHYLKRSLVEFLYFTFLRVISLKRTNNKELNKHLNDINNLFLKNLTDHNKIDNCKPIKFLYSYLYKNSLMRDPLLLIQSKIEKFCLYYNIIDIIQDPLLLIKILPNNFDFENELINLMKPAQIMKRFNFEYDLINNKFPLHYKAHSTKGYPYYPRYIQFHETTLYNINRSLFEDNCDKEILNVKEYLKKSIKLYNSINGLNTPLKNDFYKDKCGAVKKCESDGEKCKLDENKVEIIKSGGNKKKSIVRVGLINTELKKDILSNALKGKPDRSSKRLDKIATIVNEAIKAKVELLVMPEMYIPYEWVPGILDISRQHNMAMVFGIEPIIHEKCVGNYIGISLPSEADDEHKHKNTTFIMRLKKSYSPEELREYRKYCLDVRNNEKSKYVLCVWDNLYFAPYYCYEIADIEDRSIFKSCCDMILVSEFNKDTSYFTAIAESLSRDLFCYCVKVNSSEFGGTCIIQPSTSEKKYLVNLKGGHGDYVVTHKLDVGKLRDHQILSYESEIKDSELKPKPPHFDTNRVRARMNLDKRKKYC